jgi:hypothetical protein
MPTPATIRLVDNDGTIRDVPTEVAANAIESGWRVPTEQEQLGRVTAQVREEEYGGVGGAVKAGLAGAARGVTLGGSDVLARVIGGEDAAIALQGLREENPVTSTLTEIGGSIAPALITGGVATPAGAVSRLGANIARAGEGASAAARVGLAAKAGIVEGGLAGIGTGVSELALSGDPLTVERVASTLGSNALFGAGVGAAAGGVFKSAELGLRRAKGVVDGALEKRAASKAKTPIERIETGDLQHVNKQVLDAAEKSEIDRLNAELAPQRKALTDELDVWRRSNRDEHEIRTISKASNDRDMSEASGAFDRANFALRARLDDKIGFSEDPLASSKAVRVQAQALEEMQRAARAQEQLWRQELADAPARIRAGLEEVSALGAVDDVVPSRVEVRRVGTLSRPSLEAMTPNGPVPLARGDEVKGWVKDQLPPGWRSDGLETHRDFSLERALPSAQGDVAENALYIVRPSDVAKRGIMGNELNPTNLSSLRGPSRGDLPPLDLKMTPDGRLWIEDGNHRLHVAASKNESVVAKIRPVGGDWKPQTGARDITSRLQAEVSKSRSGGAALLKARKKLADRLDLYDEIGPFTDAGLDAATERVLKKRMDLRWGGAYKGGLKEPSAVGILPKIENMIAANRRLQAQLDELAKPKTSDLLTKIAEARAVIDAPKAPPGVGQELLGAAATLAGPLGAAAAAGGRTIGGLRRLAGALATRTGKAASAFLGGAGKGVEKLGPYAPVLATRTLAAVRYGDDDSKQKAQPKSLADLFEVRSREVKDQIQIAPDGSYQMRPDARAKMAAKFDGLGVADPVLADQLEESAARRIEYLAAIMPRRPDYAAMVGQRGGRISDLAMRSWARSAAALEDPQGVFERAGHGFVTIDDAAAIRAVYPELLAGFTAQVGELIAQRERPLPYKQALALSILTGEAMDPALDPKVLGVLQGSFVNDDGDPATQAPTASPSFGSVKRSVPEPTPAQQRSQGDYA